jgi:hypothetical protein
MDGPGGHYANWNNPETERKILHITYMWYPKQPCLSIESKRVSTMCGDRKNKWGDVVQSAQGSKYVGWTSLEI